MLSIHHKLGISSHQASKTQSIISNTPEMTRCIRDPVEHERDHHEAPGEDNMDVSEDEEASPRAAAKDNILFSAGISVGRGHVTSSLPASQTLFSAPLQLSSPITSLHLPLSVSATQRHARTYELPASSNLIDVDPIATTRSLRNSSLSPTTGQMTETTKEVDEDERVSAVSCGGVDRDWRQCIQPWAFNKRHLPGSGLSTPLFSSTSRLPGQLPPPVPSQLAPPDTASFLPSSWPPLPPLPPPPPPPITPSVSVSLLHSQPHSAPSLPPSPMVPLSVASISLSRPNDPRLFSHVNTLDVKPTTTSTSFLKLPPPPLPPASAASMPPSLLPSTLISASPHLALPGHLTTPTRLPSPPPLRLPTPPPPPPPSLSQLLLRSGVTSTGSNGRINQVSPVSTANFSTVDGKTAPDDKKLPPVTIAPELHSLLRQLPALSQLGDKSVLSMHSAGLTESAPTNYEITSESSIQGICGTTKSDTGSGSVFTHTAAGAPARSFIPDDPFAIISRLTGLSSLIQG
ncbi:unnamed protein product [Protopolystoma xenopodis]|uniref:Uncharacterized protein n=1 Tax=Protopolystoma xenopodis TaxID=117903 RepID=A0A3S5AX89_9PLAT|nr:unnamed protein product [Protopolystoma xenopodis]